MKDGKKVEKTVVRTLASAGHADPGKEGFWEDMDKQGLARPKPILGGWAGGLNRQSRNHRPPIHLEGLVRMTWVGQGNWLGLVG